jgi:hypothetical protein
LIKSLLLQSLDLLLDFFQIRFKCFELFFRSLFLLLLLIELTTGLLVRTVRGHHCCFDLASALDFSVSWLAF